MADISSLLKKDSSNNKNENLKKNISIKRLCKNCEYNEKIQNLNKDYCIRIKTSNEGSLLINDIIYFLYLISNKIVIIVNKTVKLIN